MGFRINGFNNDNPLNQMGGVTLSSSIRFTGSSYRTVGNSNKNSERKTTSTNNDDKVKVEVSGYNSSSSNKVDSSKGYTEVNIIGGYSVNVPKDTSWKNTPLKDENIVSREENTHQNGTEIITKYADGTIVKEYYSKNGVHVTQETRYSGDPNNPQEGDIRSTTTTYESEEGTVIAHNSNIWTEIPGISPGWYDSLVKSFSDYEVYDKDGNRVPYEMGPTSDYNRIKNGSMMIYPPSEGFFDIP